MPQRRHHVEHVADLQVGVCPFREQAARVALDGDPQDARPAHRSRSSTTDARPARRCRRAASDAAPRRSGTPRRDAAAREGDRHGVARFALDASPRKTVELAHGQCPRGRPKGTVRPLGEQRIVVSVGAVHLVRLEVVERLEAVQAAVLRLAGGRAELRQQARLRRAAARTRDRRAGTAQRTDAGDVDRRDASRQRAGAVGWRDAEIAQLPARLGGNPVGRPRRRRAAFRSARGRSPMAASASRIDDMMSSVAGQPE